MTKRNLAVLAALATTVTAYAAPLDGRQIAVTAAVESGPHTALNVPISLPFEGKVPEGHLRVMRNVGAEEFPATAANGAFTFVVDGIPAGKQATYTVQVYQDDVRAEVVQVRPGEEPGTLDVLLYDKLLTRFHHGGSHAKPFLWPVNGEGGVPLTRAYPMGKAGESGDHPHHTSLWTGHGSVNGHDFWHMKDTRQRVVKLDYASGDAYGSIRAEIAWEANDQEVILTEVREYRFYASPEKLRFIDIVITFKADHGPVVFGDTKETGIVAVRVRDALRGESGGVITSGRRNRGEEAAWGRQSPWCDYSGTLGEQGTWGIAIMGHPDKSRGSAPRWHVREYGLMAANPFGFSGFPGTKSSGKTKLDEGKSLAYHFRVYLHRGDAEEAQVSARFYDYAHPPQAAWVE